jgi:hypothetical protein
MKTYVEIIDALILYANSLLNEFYFRLEVSARVASLSLVVQRSHTSLPTLIPIRVLNKQHIFLIIGLCILLRVYQSIYIETSVRTSYTTRFGPYWWPSSGGFVTQKIRM